MWTLRLLLFLTVFSAVCCARQEAPTLRLKWSRRKARKKPLPALQGAANRGTQRVSVPFSSRLGLTWDHCEEDADCQGTRVCVYYDEEDDKRVPCTDQSSCYCLQEGLPQCNSSSVCDKGEVCARRSDLNESAATCYSQLSAEDYGLVPVQGKLNFDACTEDSECEPPRVCIYIDDEIFSCKSGEDCFCRARYLLEECSGLGECPFGEVCSERSTWGDTYYCISQNYLDTSTTTQITPLKGALTLDACESTKECENSRCRIWVSDEYQLCYGRANCRCRNTPLETCSTSSDCKFESDGEICANLDSEDNSVCLSKAYVSNSVDATPVESQSPTASPTTTAPTTTTTSPQETPPRTPTPKPIITPPEELVCIDAEALGHFEWKDLAYASHRRAKVLCDRNGSCATPGHIVSFRGESMMMKTYCALAGCHERIMMVNSPRYRKQLFVASKTPELMYTSFAARYETRTEEIVLRALVHLGM